ncbi:pyridoxal phosphate-dependent aminotransferase [Tellurirhabdus rosea]|uniref:pyridoxal phosphate-dependent aminotransferase n=1 Tax=Tellurirhabdus rosea TaxID=2674997 RepID=UPI00224F38D1|nr:histidinol-phosphate transaminase [Tellurirhabdus rosea]
MNTLSRRNWLRHGALLTAGLTAGLPRWNPAAANARREQALFEEFARLGLQPPALKARIAFNENPYGLSPKAKEALLAAADAGNRYAMMETGQLKQLIAEREGVKPQNVLLSPGSSELLAATAVYYTGSAAKGAGGKILTSQFTYDDLLECVRAFGAQVEALPLKNFGFDLAAMRGKLTPDTKLVYICNPNNPTGTVLPPDELTAFCREVAPKAPVFVDEAYIDFLEPKDRPQLPKLINEGLNVMVARTFSKIHGFAGLRLGYAIGPAKLVEDFKRYSRSEWDVSVTTIMAGIASLQDEKWQMYCRAENTKGRETLYKTLKALDYEYVPSGANFVLFPIRMKPKSFETAMFREGIMVSTREHDRQPFCRVSIGNEAEMTAFAKALKEL